jgi:hypothetical protein
MAPPTRRAADGQYRFEPFDVRRCVAEPADRSLALMPVRRRSEFELRVATQLQPQRLRWEPRDCPEFSWLLEHRFGHLKNLSVQLPTSGSSLRLSSLRARCSLTGRPAPTPNSARPVEAAVAQLLPTGKKSTATGATQRTPQRLRPAVMVFVAPTGFEPAPPP